MLRKEIEDLMKKEKAKYISLYLDSNSELAMLCTLQGGYLVDCYGHRVDRKKNYTHYLSWDGSGNADKVCFATGERIAVMRNRYPVNYKK